DTPLLRILLRAFVARRYILSRRYGLPLGGAGVALLLWAGAGFPLPQSRDASPLEARIPDVPAALEGGGAELSYRQARSHYERGAYQAARDQLALHLAQYGETPEVRALLNEVLYHLGNDALARGEWLVARRTFAELLAVAPGYRSADTLLSEAYYRAARAALERGDLAGAREELEALLARQGTYADAGALLVEAIERQARAAVEHSQLDAAAEAVLALRALDPASEALRRLLAAYPALATRAIAYDQATWERGRAWRVATLPREVHGERAALSADGTLLALWSAGQPLRIHRVMGAQLLRTLPAEAGLALDAAFSPDGRTLASVAPDGAVRLWRVGDGSLLRELTGRTAPSALAFSPDGRYLAATGGDAVSIWRADSGRLEQELAVPGAALVSPSYSRDGQFLAAGDRGRVYVWRVRDGTIVGVADAGGGTVQRLALLTEDDLLAVTAGRAVRIDAARGVILSDYSHSSGAAAQGPVTAVAPSNPQGRVAVFEGGGVAEIVPAGGEVAGLALSRDGRVLAVVMRDGSVSVWRPAP
ncbi:MAG TPA: hypothetical protein VNL77_21360, partial [Roseiflexaceae bacterium]|nr:hypothetical protein [Roseiflexaceae bacterium]